MSNIALGKCCTAAISFLLIFYFFGSSINAFTEKNCHRDPAVWSLHDGDLCMGSESKETIQEVKQMMAGS